MRKLLNICLISVLFFSCSKKDSPAPVSKSSGKTILSFAFNSLNPAISGSINDVTKTISLNVSSTTDVTNLAPTLQISDKATVSPESGTSRNFTNVVQYTVTAEDGSTQVYNVTVTKDKSNANLITSFAFNGLNPAISATIDAVNKTITATVPFGTDLTKLAPTIAISDKAVVSPVSAIIQDFSKDVIYTVTAENGTAQAYKVTITKAQPLSILWQKSFGGSLADVPNAIETTTDGGYIVAGFTNSKNGDVTGNHGGLDYWIAKVSSLGGLEWQKTLGGTKDDQAYSIKQTSDGGYIVAGQTESNDGDVTDGVSFGMATWVVKLTASGSITWQKTLSSNAFGGSAKSVSQTADGGYIVAGDGFNVLSTTSMADGVVYKLSSAGVLEWSKVVGGSLNDLLKSIQQTADGGYIAVGSALSTNIPSTNNHGSASTDYYVVKLNSSGTIVWQKLYGGSDNEEAKSVQQTSDGGFIVLGSSESIDGDITDHHGSHLLKDFGY